MTIHRALLSVHDKTGIVDFARELHRLGVEARREWRDGPRARRRAHPRDAGRGRHGVRRAAPAPRGDAPSRDPRRNPCAPRRRRQMLRSFRPTGSRPSTSSASTSIRSSARSAGWTSRGKRAGDRPDRRRRAGPSPGGCEEPRARRPDLPSRGLRGDHRGVSRERRSLDRDEAGALGNPRVRDDRRLRRRGRTVVRPR